jgi:UDP-2,3-diacylglucosamine hydrolase
MRQIEPMLNQKQPTAIFVADSHFHLNPDSAEQDRIRSFCGLMALAEKADHLFLIGDIFDFWFDYPHFRLRGYEEILQALDQVRDAGTKIHFVGGNHDIWAAQYMSQRYGSHAKALPFVAPLGDLRVKVCHGDGLLAYDWAYNTFRTIVRTRLGIVLAKSLHPEILFAFSQWLSGQSRSATRDEATSIEAKAQAWIDKCREPDWDLMIIGHLHHPLEVRSGNQVLTVLAGWFETLGYGILSQGEFRLLDFDSDPTPEI